MCDRELEPLRFYALALIDNAVFFGGDEKYVWLGFSVPVIPSLHYELNERNHHKSVSCETELSFMSEKECQASTQTFNFCQFFSWHTCAIS